MDYEARKKDGKVLFVIHKKNKTPDNNTNDEIRKSDRDLLNRNVFHKIKGPGIITADDGLNLSITFADASILTYEYPSDNFFEDCAFTRINTVKLTGTTTTLKPKKNYDEENELERFQAFLKKEKIDSEVKEMSIKEDFYHTCIWGFKLKDGEYTPVQDWMDFFIRISRYLYKKDKRIFLDIVVNQCPMKNNETPYFSKGNPSRKWFGGNYYLIIKSARIYIEQHISAREAVGFLRYCQDEYEFTTDDIKLYIGSRFKKRPIENKLEKESTSVEKNKTRPIFKIHSGFGEFLIETTIKSNTSYSYKENSELSFNEQLSRIENLNFKMWNAYKRDIIDPSIKELWYSKKDQEFKFTCDFMANARGIEKKLNNDLLKEDYASCWFNHIKVKDFRNSCITEIVWAIGLSNTGTIDFLGTWEQTHKIHNDKKLETEIINDLLNDVFYYLKKRGLKKTSLLIFNSNYDKAEFFKVSNRWNVSTFYLAGEFGKVLLEENFNNCKEILDKYLGSFFKEKIRIFSSEKNFDYFKSYIELAKKLDESFKHIYDGCLELSMTSALEIFNSRNKDSINELRYIGECIENTCNLYNRKTRNEFFSELEPLIYSFSVNKDYWRDDNNFENDVYSKIEYKLFSSSRCFYYSKKDSTPCNYTYIEDTGCKIILSKKDNNLQAEYVGVNTNRILTFIKAGSSYNILLNNRHVDFLDTYIKNSSITVYMNEITII